MKSILTLNMLNLPIYPMKYIKITTLWETMGNTIRICNAAVSYEKAKLEWMFVSSKTQKNTAVAQPREVIDVESS